MEPMLCSNCGEPLETGAVFCGNCGWRVAQQAAPAVVSSTPGAASSAPALDHAVLPVAQPSGGVAASPIAQAWSQQVANASPQTTMPGSLAVAAASGSLPTYAVPVIAHQNNELKAGMALIFGILGIVGGLFIPLVGIGMGVTALVLASVARQSARKRLSTAGIVLAILALLASMASWAYVISKDPRFNHTTAKPAASASGQAITAKNLITPCYTVNFVTALNIQNNRGSCNMNAFNGATFDASSNAYKVYGTTSAVTASGFSGLAKQAIESDVHQNLPTFVVTQEHSGQFAGSPAYFVVATNKAGISFIEAAALHLTSNGDNFFVFIHAANGNSIDLNELQAGWHWN